MALPGSPLWRRRDGKEQAERERAAAAEWFRAAVAGDKEALQRQLEAMAVSARDHGAFRDVVNRVDVCGRSALYIAAERGDIDTVRLLLSAGSSPDLRLPAGSTPVLAAIELPRLASAVASSEAAVAEVSSELVSQLLFSGANPKIPEYILAAAERGHLSSVRMLLAAGADAAARRRVVLAAKAGPTGMAPGRGAIVSKTARALAAENGYPDLAVLLDKHERAKEVSGFLQWQRREATQPLYRLPLSNQKEIVGYIVPLSAVSPSAPRKPSRKSLV
eukprot:Hpha_TRINITY_DN31628_c0_g1::TRINITY_DN31628_c0_g1_i1::g.29175::m.29175